MHIYERSSIIMLIAAKRIKEAVFDLSYVTSGLKPTIVVGDQLQLRLLLIHQTSAVLPALSSARGYIFLSVADLYYIPYLYLRCSIFSVNIFLICMICTCKRYE